MYLDNWTPCLAVSYDGIVQVTIQNHPIVIVPVLYSYLFRWLEQVFRQVAFNKNCHRCRDKSFLWFADLLFFSIKIFGNKMCQAWSKLLKKINLFGYRIRGFPLFFSTVSSFIFVEGCTSWSYYCLDPMVCRILS
jgi:hypothetical protein